MSQSQIQEKNSDLGAGQTRFQLSSSGTSMSFVCQAGTQYTLHQGLLGELNASFDLALERFLGLHQCAKVHGYPSSPSQGCPCAM